MIQLKIKSINYFLNSIKYYYFGQALLLGTEQNRLGFWLPKTYNHGGVGEVDNRITSDSGKVCKDNKTQ